MLYLAGVHDQIGQEHLPRPIKYIVSCMEADTQRNYSYIIIWENIFGQFPSRYYKYQLIKISVKIVYVLLCVCITG